jgi:tetratricopeptide (TPR) repeat protein
MQALVDNLRASLSGFIEQRDNLLLLCPCRDQDVAMTLQVLRDVDESSGTDLFLFFSHEFREASSYVAAAAKQLATEHALACEAAKLDGKPELPPLPATLLNEERPIAQRLREMLDYARAQLPREGGHRLIWGMMPLVIHDLRGWRELWSTLLPGPKVQPWMRSLRLIFREATSLIDELPFILRAPRVGLAYPDFGPAALSAALEKESKDEGLPEPQRMQSLLQVACLDYAHGREQAAIEKYQVLLAYYEQTGNLPLQAFVLNCIGDVFHRRGDLAQAQHFYERAVPPIVKSPSLVVFATIVKNLGDVAYAQRQYPRAEKYYDGWEKLAAKMFDLDSMVRAEEWRGRSQEQQGAWERATESWQAAAHLSRKVGLKPYLKNILGHLERAYQHRRMHDQLAQVRQELRGL